jgi:hypothetical protein
MACAYLGEVMQISIDTGVGGIVAEYKTTIPVGRKFEGVVVMRLRKGLEPCMRKRDG